MSVFTIANFSQLGDLVLHADHSALLFVPFLFTPRELPPGQMLLPEEALPNTRQRSIMPD